MISDELACKTIDGSPCDIPFLFKGQYYGTCINVDNGGEPWCYTNMPTMEWNSCTVSSCPDLTKGRYIIVDPKLYLSLYNLPGGN